MVAEIETDKVTIEAKSPHSGTIKAIHVEEGQTVEVGGAFFSIVVGVGEAGATVAAPAAAVPAASAAAAEPATSSMRVHPSGKRSLISFPKNRKEMAMSRAKAAAAAAAPAASAPAAKKAPVTPPPAGTIAYADLPLRFQRPLISEEEMEAIMTGGATRTW